MSKRLTIFYSWQSDTPNKLNRSFIEKALEAALKKLNSDASVESAPRVELDKDTAGEPGSPPIVDTILKKIESCVVFVADLTFVGTSMKGLSEVLEKPRLFPNPNVLIEYGYALKMHTHSAVLGIMNEAYGTPSAESLPFDLRHLAWPIRYHLSDESTGDERIRQLESLTTSLVNKLRLVLQYKAQIIVPVQPVSAAPGETAVFFDNADGLVPAGSPGRSAGPLIVPDEGRAYLHVRSPLPVPAFDTELDALIAAQTALLPPMGGGGIPRLVRNLYGAISYELSESGQLTHLTQVFLSREIWGVDAQCVNATRRREFNEEFGRTIKKPYIPSGLLTQVFIRTLNDYLRFAKHNLQLSLPFQVRAGIVGIKNHQIARLDTIEGHMIHPDLHWDAQVLSHDTAAHEILIPFFKKVWKACGVVMLPKEQEGIAQFGKKIFECR